MKTFDELRERSLTPAEKKKREEVAQAIERDNPSMPMSKKMAIATATAKKSTEESSKVQEIFSRHSYQPGKNKIGRASDEPDIPFAGPYKKAGQVRKDKYGNVIKPQNIARHLARQAARNAANEETIHEATAFRVSIEGLPSMFMYGSGPGQVLAKLRKIVKQPSMILDVERVTKTDVKKTFRLKAQGRDEEEMDEAKHTMVCKDCGCEQGKADPNCECSHDSKDTNGSWWVPKESMKENNNAPQTAAHRRAMMVGIPKKVNKPKKEEVEEANDKTGSDWEKSFQKKLKYSTSDNPKVKSYLAKKQDQRTALNKSMDPGAAKKGLALSVIDRQKAYQKGKKKGIGVMDIDTRPGKDHKTGKSNYGKKLPESVDEKSGLSTKTLGSYVSKASDASKHRGLSTRKVDNRYSGVAKASKELDQREEMTPQQKADRLALIRKVAQDRQKKADAMARRDASSAIRKDKDLRKPKKDPADIDNDYKGEGVDHAAVIARAQDRLQRAEKRGNSDAAARQRQTISKHQVALAKGKWTK